MKKYLLFTFISLFVSFNACNYFESDNPTGISKIDVRLTNLKPLADSLVYVGWITTNADSSFKIFESNVDQSGVITVTTTNNFGGLHKAQQFRITVEELPDSGSITSPGNRVVLSGRFTLGQARLNLGEEVDFNSANGVFSITTPTDSFDNNLSGVWFVDSLSRAGGPIAGLNLPLLYDGWTYEGLVLVNSDTLSIGTFSNPETADDSSKYNGSGTGFPFPGEDFLLNPPPGLTFPLDLSSAQVIVTFKLNIKNSTFATKLLEATVPAGVQANTTHPLQRIDAQVPSGLVSITVDIVE
jgi:hypothetical protein